MLSNLVSDIEAINFFAKRFKILEKLRSKEARRTTQTIRRIRSLPRSSLQHTTQETSISSPLQVDVRRHPIPSRSLPPSATQADVTARSGESSDDHLTASSPPRTSNDPLVGSSDDVREISDLYVTTPISSIPRKRKGPKPCVPFQLDPDPVEFQYRRSNLVLYEDVPVIEDSDEEFPDSITSSVRREGEENILGMTETTDQSIKRTFASEPPVKRKKVQHTTIATDGRFLKKMPSLYSQIEKRIGEGSNTKETVVPVRAKKIAYREIIEILDSP
ncbi:hypothetical protein SCHPADRAFT_712333 [Schizopora paradoxa]|uniref:Uncharacterized protein n=1 Tax=Schizopora paradoxa TaxID=27342 RepID=A0A0H2R1H1_9AGAM|nr:hypothetical protein SCHPADRAFT_721264 [Schizopora paradoxa]KLO05792.1 hypothetical protein SCHPADRAFT_712333 [Schizopora paradoxa]